MAKLKFDRSLNINIKLREKITVPYNEVWKGTITYSEGLYINGNYMRSSSSTLADSKYVANPILLNIILGGGATFHGIIDDIGVTFTGLAFKVIG
ncbi:hypothetical protein ABID14_000338 [Peptoniphilus olsenii]|uniref:Uncharacterized protein n=1 Tax=Peptoniphilus olsenii TaxID=411570 RepID=A0ABV2J7J3_9FIRM